MSQKGDVAIDDIAMSPKCFGLGKYLMHNQILNIFYYSIDLSSL
jgi:hypothetical protein